MKSSLLKFANKIPVYATGRLVLIVFVVVFYIKNGLYADVKAYNNIKVTGKTITPTVKKSSTKAKTSGSNRIVNVKKPLTTFPLSYPASPLSVVLGFPIIPIIPTGSTVPAPAYSNSPISIGTNPGRPTGVAVDAAGNIYVADAGKNSIVKILASDGSTVLIGSGFQSPQGVAVDAVGNVYVSDTFNNLVKKISVGSNVPLILASGFNHPVGITVNDGDVYVADSGNNVIKKIPSGSSTPVIIGSGFFSPTDVKFDRDGNIYVADLSHQVLKKIPANGDPILAIKVIFNSQVVTPFGLAIDVSGNIYIIDVQHSLTVLLPLGENIPVPIGSGISHPQGIAVDGAGHVFIGDEGNSLLKKFIPTGGYYIDNLPAGLKFNNTTGVISGKPTAASPATNYKITAYNASGSSSALVNIKVVLPSPPNISYVTPRTYSKGTTIAALNPTNIGGAVPPTIYGQATTLAGNGAAGSVNGTGAAASFNGLFGMATDAAGNIYTADYIANLIRKITPAGAATTFAGTGAAGAVNGPGVSARFKNPFGIAIDASGNVYVGDSGNNVIRKISPAGTVSTFAGSGVAGATDGTGTSAKFNAPRGLTIDVDGNLYVADYLNNLIRKITPAGVVSTFAGSGLAGATNGTGTTATFNKPLALSADIAGNIYVADFANNLIRKVTPAGLVTTLAGSGAAGSANGTGIAATFNAPYAVATDFFGNVYIADAGNNLIRKISPAGVVSTLAGSGVAGSADGTGTTAKFNSPRGITADGLGNLYVSDFAGHQVRRILLTGHTISPVLPAGLTFNSATGAIAGTPTATSPATNYTVTAYNQQGNGTATVNINVTVPPVIRYTTPRTYFATAAIRPLIPTNTGGAVPAANYSNVSTLAGSGVAGSANGTGPTSTFNGLVGLATDAAGNIYTADYNANVIRKISPSGVTTTLAGSGTAGSGNGAGLAATFRNPFGTAVDAAGNVYVGDSGNNLIRKITPAGVVSTFAGSGVAGANNGTGTAASFRTPRGLAIDPLGNLYVADSGNKLIRKITPGGVVTNLAGNGSAGSADGAGAAATFNSPIALSTDAAGNVFVADYANNLIRKITQGGVVSTVGRVNNPYALATDIFGNVYAAEAVSNFILKFAPAGSITTLAGSGIAESINGTGTAAAFNSPRGLATDGMGNLYVSEFTGHRVRKVLLTGYTISPALPAGLTFNSATGVIDGTPLAKTPAANYTVTAYNVAGSGTTLVNINIIAPLAPAVISYPGPLTFTAGKTIVPVSPTNSGGDVPKTIYSQTRTVAGSGIAGLLNGKDTAARFNAPWGVVKDKQGNIYVSDQGNHQVRKIAADGTVSTYGNSEGITFTSPAGIVADQSGNVYVADEADNQIKKITPDGIITIFAGTGTPGYVDGIRRTSKFNAPGGLAIDSEGNIYIADILNNVIRVILPDGSVRTVAGSGVQGNADGIGMAASFNSPTGLAVDKAGNLYVADYSNNNIRLITPDGVVSTLAGNGSVGDNNSPGTEASFNTPIGIAVDAAGNVYVSEQVSNLVRKIAPSDGFGGLVSTFAGSGGDGNTDGVGPAAKFSSPQGLAIDSAGTLYVANYGGNTIRSIATTGYVIRPALPSGLTFNSATGVIAGKPTAASAAKTYTITAYNRYGGSTAEVNLTVQATTSLPNISYKTPNTFITGKTINALIPVNTGGVIPATKYGDIGVFVGASDTLAPRLARNDPGFNRPNGIAASPSGDYYLADEGNNVIRKIAKSGAVVDFAGSRAAGNLNGAGGAASFNLPRGVVSDGSGNIYVADAGNNLIRKITPNGTVSTFAGNGATGNSNGTAGAASFNNPSGITIDLLGNLYIADVGNYQVRKITPAGVVTTLAGSGTAGNRNGTGTAASFGSIYGLAADGGGNLYVADAGNNLVRKITPGGVVTTLAGSGAPGFENGTGTSATFNTPMGITVNDQGVVYVSEKGNNAIRIVTPAGSVSTLAGQSMNTAFDDPRGIVLNGSGQLYVSEYGDNRIASVKLTGYTLNPALPPGLIFDSAMGIISGTPTANSPLTNYMVTGYNIAGHDTTTVKISVTTFTEHIVKASDTLQYIPVVAAAVSPNGDGRNDFLTITNIEKFPRNRISIINKGGAEVYTVEGYDNQTRVFDGRSGKTGQLQPPGTYFYRLEYTDKGAVKYKTGYIILKY